MEVYTLRSESLEKIHYKLQNKIDESNRVIALSHSMDRGKYSAILIVE